MPLPKFVSRRNGSEPACEPCRKGKLRCDHKKPFCGRCVRRQQTNCCIYHPAPMTRSARINYATSKASVHEGASPGSRSRPGAQQGSLYSAPASHPPPTPVEENARRSPVFRQRETDGATRFSAVFTENESSLINVGSRLSNIDRTSTTQSPLLETEQDLLPQDCMKEGIECLRYFPTRQVCERLLEIGAGLNDTAVPYRMIQTWISHIWTTYEYHLTPPASAESLSRMVTSFCNNAKDSSPPNNNPQLWLSWFTRPVIRWEIMGILFVYFGFTFMILQEDDKLFDALEPWKISRKTAAWKMKECADICIRFCDELDIVTDLVVLLLLNVGVLESWCIGDEIHRVNRRFGDVNAAVFASGLHLLKDGGEVSAMSEYRKTWFLAAYCSDKGVSSFNGRPPGLTRHYCRCSIALDLNEDELLGDPALLAAAVARLDENGWRTDGEFTDRTLHRALAMQTPIREGTLELSLGVDVQISRQQIDDLINRLNEIAGNYPPHIQYHPERASKLTGLRLMSIICIHLEYLQNLFLLERLKISHTRASGQELLDIAVHMMKMVLLLWLQRDRLLYYTFQFDWFVVSFGIPAAGVLCVELLKQTRTLPEVTVHISRSEVIQQLTMFIGFLDWVRPTDGNYKLCGKVSRVVQKIIDHVLETPPPPPHLQERQLQEQQSEGRDEGTIDDTLTSSFAPYGDDRGQQQDGVMWGFSGEPDVYLDLLNDVDWTHSAWFEFEQ